MRSLIDIYKSYNFIVMDLESYKKEVWVIIIEENIKMIEKNKIWELMD